MPFPTPLAAFLRRWQIPILAAITLLAAVLRFYRLPEMPPGLYGDEAWSGLMAREVLQTGQLKVFFASNQGVEPLVVYLALPVVALLGSPIWQLRIPEAIVGTLTIPAIWWMCRELFGRRSARPDHPPTEDEYVASSLAGLGAALALAVLFWHINHSRIGMEPILVPLFMCLTFATLARALDTRRARDYAIAGVVLAGNLYTYKAGYAVPPLAAVFVAWLAISDRGLLRREWRSLAIWVGAALLAYLPMIIFAATHPGDFFLRFGSVTVESQLTPQVDLSDNALKVLKMFFIAGDENQRHNIPGRPILDPLMAGLFLVGLWSTVRALRKPRQGIVLVWLVVMSLPTLLSEFAPNYGRAIGAMPAIALLCALGAYGLWQVSRETGLRWVTGTVTAVIALVVVVSGATSIRDYFVVFSQKDFLFYSFEEGSVRLAQYVNTVPADQRVYVVTELPDPYTLRYVADRPFVTYDGRAGVVYPSPDHEATAVVIVQQARGLFRQMQAARPDADESWQLADRGGSIFARALHFPAAGQAALPPSRPVEATLDGAIRLVGYDLSADRAAPGEAVELTLYWQSIQPVSQDYTVFTHLIAGQPLPDGGVFLTGDDRQPIAATYPTSVWQPGETILDRHTILIPPDAPPGVYHLKAGMYLLETLVRLPALDVNGSPLPDDTVELGTVEVAAN